MRLRVYFLDKLTGEIERTERGTMQFRYAGSWLSDAESFALSYSLPKSDKTYTQEADFFFGNYLPEGPVRQAICEIHRISIDNDFELLRKIGGECAGALVISENSPETTPYQYKDLELADLAKHVARDTVYAAMTELPNMRLSLAGAQDKLPVFLTEECKIKLPLGTAPSTHILKFANTRFKELVPNECYITRLVKELGLETVDVDLIPVGKDFFLIVKRYDRIRTGNNEIMRLHQEDMCQALGVNYRIKYENEGGPTFSRIYQLVTEASRNPLIDNRKLLQWQIANILIGNCDGHAKNVSLLRSIKGEWRIAPFYDLVCTTVYPNLSKDLAMGIGGIRNFGNLMPVHWTRMAEELRIGSKLLRSMVVEMWEKFPDALESTHEKMTRQYGDVAIFRRIRETLSKNHDRMIK